MKGYIKEAKCLINPISQWIEGYIHKEQYDKNKEAFDYFISNLQQGKSLYDAKKETQKKFQLEIEYDTIFPEDSLKKSTLAVMVGVKQENERKHL